MKKILLSMIITAALFSSCYYDKEDVLYKYSNTPCDTTVVTYSGSIVPILTSNCLGCHAGATAPSSVRLDQYSGVFAVVSNGKLINAITHSPGASPMPKNGNKLNDCSINQIKKWIAGGALQN